MEPNNENEENKNSNSKPVDIDADDELEGGHYCRYCGHKEMLINDHFAHIEFEHPDKPLI